MRKINLSIKNLVPSKSALIFLVLLFLIFFFKAITFLDPDFGWRLKAGEFFIRNGIPKTDIFTYTMPTFPWVEHAWNQSIFFYIVHRFLGYTGLAFSYSFLVCLAIFLMASRAKEYLPDKKVFKNIGLILKVRFFAPKFLEISPRTLGVFASFPLLLLSSLFFTFFGIRVQVISWLAFSVLLFILFEPGRLEKFKFYSPLLFFVWANVHGSFLSGLGTYWAFIILRWFRRKKVEKSELAGMAVSGLVTLINPYGSGIWREALASGLDSKLRLTIAEWMPALTMLDLGMVLMIGISLGMIWKYRKRFLLEEKGLYFAFLFQALATRRHLPLWAIIAFLLLCKSIFYLWEDARKVKDGERRFAKVYSFIWVISFAVLVVQAFFSFREGYFVGLYGAYYPQAATIYLRDNLPSGQIFSLYGWGGYLVWKLPEKEVFVDGRMPSWRWSGQPEGELASAFDIYNDIWRGEISYKDTFEKFDVGTVLWQKPLEEDSFKEFTGKIENYLTVFGYKKNDFDLLKTLEDDGWKKVYEDDTAVIYQDPP